MSRVDELIKKVKALRNPLPFLAHFKDGSRRNISAGEAIDMVSKNDPQIVKVEKRPEAAGQGQLESLINGLIQEDNCNE